MKTSITDIVFPDLKEKLEEELQRKLTKDEQYIMNMIVIAHLLKRVPNSKWLGISTAIKFTSKDAIEISAGKAIWKKKEP